MKPARMPEVKITLKASYLMCENEPRFVLHGTEGSYVKYGLDPQEADLTKGMLPDTPHWGEEDESQWGILHTETDGNVVRKPYPTLPGNYAAFMRIFISISGMERCCKVMRAECLALSA